ncbi:hypothetical protein GCM10009087_42080 [Sphingomonas oligophenolica]|uniref:DUF4262 domain-containing protein n=1 Tax=Sphingomonas oligophenolica TaxID=301154 RepID=A0ABU9YCI7_9SPHN
MAEIPTALELPASALNDYERDLVADIRQHGWQGTHVCAGDDQPGFSYSIGFFLRAKLPEILIFSLPANVAHSILAHIFEKAADGYVPPVGVAVSDLMVGYDCYFFPIAATAYREYPLSSTWFYRGTDYPCLQLVWTDEAGLFPWQPGFNERFRDDQPDVSADGWIAHLAN